MVILQGRSPVSMDMVFPLDVWGEGVNGSKIVFTISSLLMVRGIIFGVYDNGPARWKGAGLVVDVNRLEIQTSENRSDGQIMAIGKAHECRSHGWSRAKAELAGELGRV